MNLLQTTKQINTFIIVTLLTLILSACGSTPPAKIETIDSSISTPKVPAYDARLEQILAEASRLQSPLAEARYLEAAEILFERGYPGESSTILSLIQSSNLPANLKTEVLILKAQILIAEGKAIEAIPLLNSEEFSALPRLRPDLQLKVRQLRAESYLAGGQYLLSAQERINLDSSLSDEQKIENHELIWQALTILDAELLDELASSSIAYEFQGWYELAQLGKAYRFNPDRQLAELEQWQQRWNRHPAHEQLPLALLPVAELIEERPQKIALLLPLQTAAGKVIRDGFMSAYFYASEIGLEVPELSFYDTSNSEILALHSLAREEGAQLIIGPLLKHQVSTLQGVRNLGVPTLALNTPESSNTQSRQFYQFALAPENEIEQIVQRAWNGGLRRAAILSPLESESGYFTRKRNNFIQRWQSLGGKIVADEVFQNDFTSVIENLIDISDSELRKESLEDLIRTSVEFTPRRRQDIDFIFLIAEPGAARQINPSLAYLYAGDIPVIATQDLYAGKAQPQLDTDLNGITFADTPWLLENRNELKNQTQLLFPQTSATLTRLQAFGVDVFTLYPRLKLLEESGVTLYGATGILRMDTNRAITQELSWARISEGLAVPETQ